MNIDANGLRKLGCPVWWYFFLSMSSCFNNRLLRLYEIETQNMHIFETEITCLSIFKLAHLIRPVSFIFLNNWKRFTVTVLHYFKVPQCYATGGPKMFFCYYYYYYLKFNSVAAGILNLALFVYTFLTDITSPECPFPERFSSVIYRGKLKYTAKRQAPTNVGYKKLKCKMTSYRVERHDKNSSIN